MSASDTRLAPVSRQLTRRAVATGVALGGLMALSNLYTTLRTGLTFGVTITSAMLGFCLWSLVARLNPRVPPLGALENNAMQTVASAAGWMSGGGTAAALPALMLVTGQRLGPVEMAVWIGSIALLGVVVAIPLKRQMVDTETLPFPSGTAAAEMVKSLHGENGENRERGKTTGPEHAKPMALGAATLFAAGVTAARDMLALIPGQVAVFGKAAAAMSFRIEPSLMVAGAGALMGLRATLSQLAGAVVCFGLLAPWAASHGAIKGTLNYASIVSCSIWLGSSLMLTSGVLQLALGWRGVWRGLGHVGDLVGTAKGGLRGPATAGVPASWFRLGLLGAGTLVVTLERSLFSIPVWLGVLSVLFSLVASVVVSRATAETDVSPHGAIGKLAQLVFAALGPGTPTLDLMAAHASAGSGIHAADLLTDLKSGHILGADPKQQVQAQLIGVAAGSLIVVPAYLLLVPNAAAIGGDRYPAPAAMAWAAVARLLSEGLSSLDWTRQWCVLAGGLAGILLVVLERALPRWRRFLPSPVAFGLAFTLPAWIAIVMTIGALAAFAVSRQRPGWSSYVIPAASGLIAGESIVGVAVGVWTALRP